MVRLSWDTGRLIFTILPAIHYYFSSLTLSPVAVCCQVSLLTPYLHFPGIPLLAQIQLSSFLLTLSAFPFIPSPFCYINHQYPGNTVYQGLREATLAGTHVGDFTVLQYLYYIQTRLTLNSTAAWFQEPRLLHQHHSLETSAFAGYLESPWPFHFCLTKLNLCSIGLCMQESILPPHSMPWGINHLVCGPISPSALPQPILPFPPSPPAPFYAIYRSVEVLSLETPISITLV